MSILTVCAAVCALSPQPYPTIAAAVAASKSGDTIQVAAGTYPTKDVKIGHTLTIAGRDGLVDVVPISSPKINVGKGLFIVGTATSAPDVTVTGLTFSGAKSGQSNGAGIRYQSGNLTLSHDTFHDNQDGILANPFVDGTGEIRIDNSIFDHNGAGDGQSHNLYIGFIKKLTLTNSRSTDAVVGHEVKTRAATGDIEGNTISDGPTGTASYSIDIPNGGNYLVRGNTIEKGPKASTPFLVHVGGPEMQNTGQVVISGSNRFINGYGPRARVVWNQTLMPVLIQGNVLTGFSGVPVRGRAELSGNTDGAGQPIADARTRYGTPALTLDFSADPTAHTLTTTRADQVVQGGAGRLTITPGKAYGTFIGGSGGITVLGGAAAQTAFTAAGSANQVSLGNGAVIFSAGTGDVLEQGRGSRTSVLGTADVTMATAGVDDLYVSGIAKARSQGGNDSYLVRPGGKLTVAGWSPHWSVNEHDGAADFSIASSAEPVGANPGRAPLSATFEGGAVSVGAKGSIDVWQGASTPAVLLLRQGTFKVTPLAPTTIAAGAADVTVDSAYGAPVTFSAGTGTASLRLSAASTVTAGRGATTVVESRKAPVVYHFVAGNGGGSTTITGFDPGSDKLVWVASPGHPLVPGATADPRVRRLQARTCMSC